MATSLRAAIDEAYASVKNDVFPLHAIEMYHASFTQPLRAVRWEYSLPEPRIFNLRHEAAAPVGPGGTFPYVGMPFDLTMPESSQNTEGTFQLRFMAFDGVESYLSAAALNPGVIRMTYREYIMDRESEGPAYCWYDITITSPRREGGEVKAEGAVLGWTSRPFGGLYLPLNYPALTSGR
jgi:hypothetical protein